MRLLLVEDKDSFRRLLLKALEETTWEVSGAADPLEALKVLEKSKIDVLVTDLRLPGMSGLELLKRARRFNPSMRIILMSAFGEAPDIVEALHSGADDFLPKPFDLDIFLNRLEKLRSMLLAPPPQQQEPWVVASESMQAVEKELRAVAETTKPVIFAGQAGTGRSRAARRLHLLRHPAAPFFYINARDLLPDTFNESFLKDHLGGSLLLKDLEQLPSNTLPILQEKLEQHPDHCWMGTCTDHQNLPESLRSRLGVFCVGLSPLAQRRDDILPLFHSYLLEACKRDNRLVPTVDPKLEKILTDRPWHGNVAELVRVATGSAHAEGLLKEIPSGFETSDQSITLPKPPWGKLNKMLRGIANSAERRFLEEALSEANGDAALAAESLGISVKGFIQKLKEHGVGLG
jgi:DNA-binding NtrC family response regulator